MMDRGRQRKRRIQYRNEEVWVEPKLHPFVVIRHYTKDIPSCSVSVLLGHSTRVSDESLSLSLENMYTSKEHFLYSECLVEPPEPPWASGLLLSLTASPCFEIISISHLIYNIPL